MSIRKCAVNGTFYPSECEEIEAMIETFNRRLEASESDYASQLQSRALIVPHAGYIYSGFTANAAFQNAAKNSSDIDTVIVIGPSHRVFLQGASVCLDQAYQTPCTTLPINTRLSQQLFKMFDWLGNASEAHHEHSTEVQMPFIAHYFPSAKVVEIVYGECRYEELAQLIESIIDNPSYLIVISTDLSHFYTQEEANLLDAICIDAVEKLDMQAFESGCEACGKIGVKAVVTAAIEKGYDKEIIDYRTSYDTTGDDTRVVGYLSAVLGPTS